MTGDLPRADESAHAGDSVVTMKSALWVRRGAPPSMPKPHRHDDVEVNLVLDGRLDYLFGGSYVSVTAGQVAVFWAATPHRLVGANAEESGDVCWVHIPLSTVLSWGLPDRDLGEVLMMRPVIVPAQAVGRDLGAMFESWCHELIDDDAATIALLEAQALVRRALKHYRETAGEAGKRSPAGSGDAMRNVTVMAQFTVAHYRDPISPSDIARAAHLNPNYAMTLFREAVGTTLGSYLTRCRVAEAQRLLITTAMTTTEIAHAAGFGSQSSFYDHFTRACGRSPGAYRRALR